MSTANNGWISYGNGEFQPSQDLSIPVMDDFLGVIRGIRVFTTTVTAGNVFFHLNDHVQRVVDAAKTLRIPLSESPEEIAKHCQDCLDKSRAAGQEGPGAMCLIASGGDGNSPGRIYVLLKDFKPFEQRLYTEGARLESFAFQRYIPLVKLTHYLGGHMAKESQNPDTDFTFFVTPEGQVLEGDTFSLFFISGQKIITPPVSDGILDGITRRLVCRLIQDRLPYELEERHVQADEIPNMDEAFLTSSLRRVMPIHCMDGHTFDSPGAVSTAVRNAVQHYYSQYPSETLSL